MEKMIPKKDAAQIYRDNDKKVIDSDVDGFVVLKNVNKVYDNRVQAVFDFNLSIEQNEFIVLVGPSGCGKSTTLRMIAGLEEITSGYLYIDKVLSNYLESKDRDIAMVFQSYALYPNLTVYDNIGFGLKARGVAKDIIKQKVFEAAEILDLGPYLDRRPRELSGGQMQRVALGRAIVRDAKLFLMDEPLSNLDAKLRVQMRSEIVKLHKNIRATTIYVTHDQTEAMTMADRIVIMNKGVVQQIGSPMEIYNDPANVFVATFIGNPPMNVLTATVENGAIDCNGASVRLPKGTSEKYAEFVSSRRAFFEDLKRKVDPQADDALRARINAFLKEMKKYAPDKCAEELDAICADAQALAEEKGFFEFDETRADALKECCKARDFGGLKTALVDLKFDIVNSDLVVAGILKKFDSAGLFKAKSKDIEIPQAGKKKKKKEPPVPLSVKNEALIDRYLEEYAAPDAEKRMCIGIRPEDIHFASDFKGKKSDTFKVTASFVELLGSEFNVYIDIFDKRIIMKSGLTHVVKTGDELELCFDMDKLLLFDATSFERIR